MADKKQGIQRDACDVALLKDLLKIAKKEGTKALTIVVGDEPDSYIIRLRREVKSNV